LAIAKVTSSTYATTLVGVSFPCANPRRSIPAGFRYTPVTRSQQVEESSQAAVDRLRSIARIIKACPGAESTTVFGTAFEGPPLNLIWDVKPGSSVRAPYAGYIEFVLARYFAVAASSDQCLKCKGPTEYCIHICDIIRNLEADTKSVRYRYEFDLGPDGLELARALSRPESAETNDWIAGMPNGCWGEDAIKLSAVSVVGPAGIDPALWEKAKTGDQGSELSVGIYFLRKATAQDDAQAVDWFRRASNQGNDAAHFFLGLLYEEGRGVKQNYQLAVSYYSSAAEHGHALAQLNLGALYYTGQGVPRDYAQAEHWYHMAAEQKNSVAQVNLGDMYFEGHGVHQDEVEAYVWLTLGISGDLPADRRPSAESLHSRIESRLSPRKLREAQERARSWADNHK
jgi:hypothetical protein